MPTPPSPTSNLTWQRPTKTSQSLLRDKRQPAEAMKAFMSQLAILQKLADAKPAVSDIQTALANGYQGIGLHLRTTGKLAEALEAYKSAQAILQKLADANPTVTDHQWHLARNQGDIAAVLRGIGKPAEALKAYESALAISQKLADANPTVTDLPGRAGESVHQHRRHAEPPPESRPRR